MIIGYRIAGGVEPNIFAVDSGECHSSVDQVCVLMSWTMSLFKPE
jgi:hypothetical protein